MFNTATNEEIKGGQVTDVYFERTQKILEENNVDKKVRMEVRAKNLPSNSPGILTGLDEAVQLFEGTEMTVWSSPEGSVFFPYEPVLMIEGNYRGFAPLETPLLGLICQASGISTKARIITEAAEDKPVFHFGSRRMHPAISPMIGRSAYIGGCDGVAVTKTARQLGLDPVGTIPHALILLLEDSTTATGMFEEIFGKDVDTVALVDTFGDEKFEALENAELIKGLKAVRLDTPSSRRGDMLEIAKEVRWELDLHGFTNVDIFISGGLNEETIPELNEVADAYGVGTSISNAPVVDFSLDIVEIEGEPISKRGKKSGAKQLYLCEGCNNRTVRPFGEAERNCPQCGGKAEPAMKKLIEDGEVISDYPEAKAIREYSISQPFEK
ncbi:nicotinate phosphoribosyltransferase [Candidatus Bipolaricaulota bacterium]|nr:nicotinate phosphoribosyltransferase [Candidatus Bipolaricaulota bacterium]